MNIPDFGEMKTMVVLTSSASPFSLFLFLCFSIPISLLGLLCVFFCVISSPSSSLPYAFSLFSLSLFFLSYALPPCLFFSLFFSLSCSLCFPFLFPLCFFLSHPVFSFFLQLSPPPNSLLSLAFITRGYRRYGRNIVTASVHHGGEEYPPRDMPLFDCSSIVFATNASPVFIASYLFEEENE